MIKTTISRIPTEEVRYMHFRQCVKGGTQDTLQKGGFTIAFIVRVLRDGTEETTYGYSICHPDENYNKKTGREYALESLQKEGRLLDSDYFAYDILAKEVFFNDRILKTREYLG